MRTENENTNITENSGYAPRIGSLLPCPFCGATPEILRIGNAHTKSRKVTIRCPECRVERVNAGVRFGLDLLQDISIKQWNQRVSPNMKQTE